MAFLLLGSLAVHDELGRPLAVPGNKAKALLALLLVRANARVPTDQLEDELWDGAPPRGARSTVQAHVSRLRTVLKAAGGSATLSSSGGGYQLQVDQDAIDVHRFEALARRGDRILADDPAEAADLLGRALDEWRGPALQDVRHVPTLYLEAVRLDELRLATTEARMAAELATGGHVMAVSSLQRFVQEHPYREQFRALLMLALYRSGRQVEALRSYQAARAALAEIGVEPGHDLRALEESISREDPSLRTPARVLAPIVAVPKCRIVLLEGPGAHSTVEAMVESARSAGRLVLRGRASTTAAPPYQSVADALTPLLADELDRGLTQALAPIVGADPPAAGVDPAFQRFRAFEAVAGLLDAHAVAGPLLLVLENIDHAGSSTLDLVEHLARHTTETRLTIVASRSAERRGGEIDAWLRRLERDGLGQRSSSARGRDPATAMTSPEPAASPDYAGLAADAFGRAALLSARAGDEALLRLGFEEAANHYGAALAAMDLQPEPQVVRRAEVLIGLGRACHAAYRLDAALDAFRRAAACAATLGDPHLMAEAAVGVATATEFGMADGDIVALLSTALDTLPDETQVRVELLAGLARALPRQDPAAVTSARRAVSLARRLDAPRALAVALATSILVSWGPGRAGWRLDDIEEVIARAEELEWVELAIEARAWRAATLEQLGREHDAAAEIEVVRAWAEQSRRPFFLALASMHAIASHLRRGSVDEAEAALADLPSGADTSPNFSAGFAAQLFLLRRLQRRVREFVPLFEMLTGDERAPAAWHAARVLALAESGDPSAGDALDAAVARLPDVHEDWLWLATVALLADACVHLGDRRAAAHLRRLLWPHRGETVVVAHGVASLGPVTPRLEALARLARPPSSPRQSVPGERAVPAA